MKRMQSLVNNCVTSVFDMQGDWMMEVIDDTHERYAEAWIYRKNCGVKFLMFGSSYNQPTCKNFNDFLSLAIANFDSYTDIVDEDLDKLL